MKMLLQLCVSLLIILALCQELASYKPIRLSPKEIGKEIEFEEGQFFLFECEGKTLLKFVYPESFQNSTTSSYYISYVRKDDVYTHHFMRFDIIFGDTGWYGCANHNYHSTNFSDTEIDWLYVYVKSKKNLFVETDNNVPLSAIPGGSIVIPCRTTSMSVKPILIKGNEELKEVPFDSKIGFTIRNLSLEDSNHYKCSINKSGEEHVVNYVLSVLKESLPEPKIQVNDLFIASGQDLKMNCTVEMKLPMNFKFEWNIPQNNSRRSIQQFKHLNENTITSHLTIFNVTNKNSGNYECVIKSIYDKKKTTRNIVIYNRLKSILFINKTETYFQKRRGENVEIIFNVDAVVEPYLQWFKPNGNEIVGNSRSYNIFEETNYDVYNSGGKRTHLVIILKIFSLNVTDTGIYLLQAKKDYIIERTNITLDVIDKPILKLHFYSYNTLNKTVQFRCEIMSNPYPIKRTWSFLEYPNYPSFHNSILHRVNETRVTAAYNSSYIFESIANVSMEMSGKITCEACNDLGCDSKTENVISAASPFLVETNMNETELRIIVEDNMLLKKNNQYSFERNSQELHIEYFMLNDTGKYSCRADNTEGINETYQHITVKASPFFVETNMNETELRIIDMFTEGQKTVILQCFADGRPKPTVTWYKDNILLKQNNKYFFQHNNQELHIKYLMLNDTGKYSCRADNAAGTSETYQHITVKGFRLDVILITSISSLGFVLIISAICFSIKIFRKKKLKKKLRRAGLMHFEKDVSECLNPNLTVDEQIELLPYNKNWEFPRDRLILKRLGCGHFGMVFKAEAIGISKNEDITTVAVKMVRRTTDSIYIRALASELKIMVHLGKHLNIVNLLGAYTQNISKCELLVIVEYCHFGNLHNYLLRHRNDFINQINLKTGKHDFTIGKDVLTKIVNVSNDNSNFNANAVINVVTQYSPGKSSDSSKTNSLTDNILSDNLFQSDWGSTYCNDNSKPICTLDLLSWAFQVARGMEYLCQRKILHGDLAARNILLAKDNVVKICDFGLAKNIYKDDNYKKTSKIPVPIKWMAIESIRDGIFSTQSDVWSFGVMLWEFFTLAQMPYPGMEPEKQYQKLIEGYRMEQPLYAVAEIYDIMLQCWIDNPMLRPNFTDLVKSIGNLLEESVKMHYITLNNSYMDINTINLNNDKNDYLMMMCAPDYAILSSPSCKGENSSSNKTSDSSNLRMSSGCPTDESKIVNPSSRPDNSNIGNLSPTSDSKNTIDLPPMSQHEEDPYLKPINVQERRMEFARQTETIKKKTVNKLTDQNSIYYNVPRDSLQI